MKHPEPAARRGAALFAALIVALIVCSLGLSLLLTAQTESRIARNEEWSTQALYVAEAGAHAVKAWFDRPGRAPGFPASPAIVVRRREIVDERDPYGSGAAPPGPEYKEGVDLDDDGSDDLFRRPFVGAPEHRLLGRRTAPDLRIDDADYLDDLSDVLFGGFPAARAGVRARIAHIEVYAPPYVRTASGWSRRGMGTLRVRGGIYRHDPGGARRPLAERTVTLVLGRVAYSRTVSGPVHSCGDLSLIGSWSARWGGVFALGRVLARGGVNVPHSLPRALPASSHDDPLWTDDGAWVAELSAKMDPAEGIPDPWLRLVAGGLVEGAPSDVAQPFAGPPPPPPGTPAPWPCCDGSNVQHGITAVACPGFDYRQWKRIATSGDPGVHYFAWSPRGGFQEDGVGAARSFPQIFHDAGGREGLFFFDTADRQPPRDDDGDGRYDNLTPVIEIGGDWTARGLVYANAERVRSTGLYGGTESVLRAPAEPRVADGSGWVDLSYPTDPAGPAAPGEPGEWSAAGPPIEAVTSFHGILYNSGSFEAETGGLYYGSVIGASGVVLDGSLGPATVFCWDASLEATWPPESWDLPRVTVTGVRIEP